MQGQRLVFRVLPGPCLTIYLILFCIKLKYFALLWFALRALSSMILKSGELINRNKLVGRLSVCVILVNNFQSIVNIKCLFTGFINRIFLICLMLWKYLGFTPLTRALCIQGWKRYWSCFAGSVIQIDGAILYPSLADLNQSLAWSLIW